MSSPDIQAFIERWHDSGAAERANYQLFLTELCQLLDVPGPEPATPDDHENAYVFEKSVVFHHGDGTSTTKLASFQHRNVNSHSIRHCQFGYFEAEKARFGDTLNRKRSVLQITPHI